MSFSNGPQSKPGASHPAARDPRLEQIVGLLERARFDAAERKAIEILTDQPDFAAAKILLLVTQARRARSLFDFAQAIEHYCTILMLDSHHVEARQQLEVLRTEAEHSKELYERVFGVRGR